MPCGPVAPCTPWAPVGPAGPAGPSFVQEVNKTTDREKIKKFEIVFVLFRF